MNSNNVRHLIFRYSRSLRSFIKPYMTEELFTYCINRYEVEDIVKISYYDVICGQYLNFPEAAQKVEE